jgi:hypothetical protein
MARLNATARLVNRLAALEKKMEALVEENIALRTQRVLPQLPDFSRSFASALIKANPYLKEPVLEDGGAGKGTSFFAACSALLIPTYGSDWRRVRNTCAALAEDGVKVFFKQFPHKTEPTPCASLAACG